MSDKINAVISPERERERVCKLLHGDCLELMKKIPSDKVDLTLTDIPYGEVNRNDNGLRKLDKENADIETFDLQEFLKEIYRITKGTIIIFCGKEQLSEIHKFFSNEQKKNKGTVRQLIWEKCLSGSTEVIVRNKNDNMIYRKKLKDIYRSNFKLLQVYNGENWIDIYNIIESLQDKYIEVRLRNGNTIRCTDEHKFYVGGNEILAEDIKVGQVLDSVRIPIGNKFEKSVYLSNELKWFIGHFVAEGSYSYDNNKNRKTIQIATNKNNQRVLEKIDLLCSQYGATYSVYDKVDGDGRNIAIHSKVLMGVLSEYVSGELAYGKHFSTKCFNIDKESLNEILLGYLDGDGHCDEKNNRWQLGFSRKNYELAKDLIEMCNILGYSIHLHHGKTKINEKEYGTWEGRIKFLKTNHFNEKSDFEVVEIKHFDNNDGYKFYDLQLQDSMHKYCLFDGILTHNCNPSPMNGQHIYLSGIENAVWFKKRGAVFNAHCKNTVFRYSCGRSKLHPTEKNHDLLKELIIDNSNEGQIVFDPCMGSGSHLLMAQELNRSCIGIELNKEYFNIAKERINSR